MNETKQIVCPACNTINRVPAARLGERPKCGRCKNLLFQGKPTDLNQDNFARHVEKNDIPVLIDFWAPWCGPCKMMGHVMEQIASYMEPEIRVAKLNTEVNQTIAATFGIRSIPTIIIFKQGREIARQSGAMDADSLRRWITSCGI